MKTVTGRAKYIADRNRTISMDKNTFHVGNWRIHSMNIEDGFQAHPFLIVKLPLSFSGYTLTSKEAKNEEMNSFFIYAVSSLLNRFGCTFPK